MESKIYTVIMGDLKGSRSLPPRGRHQAQLFLKSTLAQINENYENFVEAHFMISKGDEFQGVLSEPSTALDIINELERLLFPLDFRFGLGIGIIHKMGGKIPIEMDGPAFHKASAAINTAKQKKQNIVAVSDYPFINDMLNQTFILIQAIKSKWKTKHYEYYWDFKEIGNMQMMAKKRRISPQAVSEQIKKLHIKEIIFSESTLRNTLKAVYFNYHKFADFAIPTAKNG